MAAQPVKENFAAKINISIFLVMLSTCLLNQNPKPTSSFGSFKGWD